MVATAQPILILIPRTFIYTLQIGGRGANLALNNSLSFLDEFGAFDYVS